MSPTTASATVITLRSLFARFGLPDQVVTDNGPQFIAGVFKEFLNTNMIKHTLCPLYHPSTNGLAERHVQTFETLRKKSDQTLSLQHKVANLLFCYCNIPHTTTGRSPAELFLKRALKTSCLLLSLVSKRKL